MGDIINGNMKIVVLIWMVLMVSVNMNGILLM